MDERILLQEAARRYGVKVSRLQRAAWDGRLDAPFMGSQRVVVPSEVERFLDTDSRRSRDTPASAARKGTQMARIIAVAVPKGGTGKTTTTLNLGVALAEHGKRVLLVDFDPQASLTLALGLRPDQLTHTVYSAMKQYLATFEPDLHSAIQTTQHGVDLVPSSIRLNLANAELTVAPQGELVLKKLLAPLRATYDVILVDTLPYLGILVENALVAADEVLIPLEADFLATELVALMLQQVRQMRKSELNAALTITGILLTQVDTRTVLHRQYAEFAREEFGSQVRVFDTTVRRSVRFPELQATHQSILQYDPKGDGARAYRRLAEEVLGAES